MTAKGLRRSLDSIDNEWSAPKDDAPDAPSTDSGAAPPRTEWKVNVEGREIVEMSAGDIVAKLRAGELPGQTLAWREGMDDWTALDGLPAFQLAAPVSSRPAASEARPKAGEDVTVKRAPQRTEVGLQPPMAPVIEEAGLAPYEPEDATSVRVLPEVPTDEATVIRDPETLPPPPPGPAEAAAVAAKTDDLGAVLAVYERPVATLAFPELDAPSDEETVVSEPPESSEPPAASGKSEEPPVPPLPKLPSRALVSTAAAAFLPPSQATRSPSGAPRLSSLGPATASRPSSPSSPAITKKPLAPSGAVGPLSRPAPLVEALLSLTEKTGTPAATPSTAPVAKVSSPPPLAPSAKAPSAPPFRGRSDAPAARSDAALQRAEKPIVAERPVVIEKPVVPGTPTPSPATVEPPPAPASLLSADSDPLNEAPPPHPPLPMREPPAVAAIATPTSPTIILREDRDADTLITNLRLGRSVPLRTAVAGAVVSTLLGSLFTGLLVSALQPEPRKAAPIAAVTVTAAPVPPPAPEPPKPAEAATPEASASEPAIPSVSARELAAEKTEKKPKKSETRWTAPRARAPLTDPESALPDDTRSSQTGSEKPASSPGTPGGDADGAEATDPSAKHKAAWETSPNPGF